MSRNFSLGQRDMERAGRAALDQAARSGHISFSTAANNSERWRCFTKWAKEHDIKKMENVSKKLVTDYGLFLAEQVRSSAMAASTAQNYVSAVNSVMTIATNWHSVSPTKDCGIEQRCAVRQDTPAALNREIYGRALAIVSQRLGERASAVVELARELGLRTKEASLLNAREALKEALRKGQVTLRDGTKGGRERDIPITLSSQKKALQRASQAQGKARAVMPEGLNWKTWRSGELRETRNVIRELTGGSLHDLRASYACERYEALAQHPAPCTGASIQDRQLDEEARLQIALELGHSRIEVVAEYVGGRG